jgi:uncharacterized protein (TIGR00369 family)
VQNRPKENQETVPAGEITELQRRGIEARVEKNPVLTFMGIEVLEVCPGGATVLLRHREDFHNSLGHVQGGVLAVVADVAGGISLYSVLPDPREVAIPTVEFKLNFLRPAGSEDLLAQGRVLHRGRQIAVCQVDVTDRSGKHLATGLFTYMVRAKEDLDSG